MLGVLVTFRYGNQFNEAQIRQVAEDAQARFKGMPGLRSKAFTVDSAKREAVNFYVWDSASAARAFFSPAMLDRVTGLYGVTPSVQFLEVAALVENRPKL
jgi:uncharacterized protein YfiM (DUF2279 family)